MGLNTCNPCTEYHIQKNTGCGPKIHLVPIVRLGEWKARASKRSKAAARWSLVEQHLSGKGTIFSSGVGNELISCTAIVKASPQDLMGSEASAIMVKPIPQCAYVSFLQSHSTDVCMGRKIDALYNNPANAQTNSCFLKHYHFEKL